MKTFSSSWLMPSMLLGTLEIEGFGTVMFDSGIWADFDMENWEWMTEVKMWLMVLIRAECWCCNVLGRFSLYWGVLLYCAGALHSALWTPQHCSRMQSKLNGLLLRFVTAISRCLCGFIFHIRWVVHIWISRSPSSYSLQRVSPQNKIVKLQGKLQSLIIHPLQFILIRVTGGWSLSQPQVASLMQGFGNRQAPAVQRWHSLPVDQVAVRVTFTRVGGTGATGRRRSYVAPG